VVGLSVLVVTDVGSVGVVRLSVLAVSDVGEVLLDRRDYRVRSSVMVLMSNGGKKTVLA
jgi:hypothetical protein